MMDEKCNPESEFGKIATTTSTLNPKPLHPYTPTP
jgi:hypothetical protein